MARVYLDSCCLNRPFDDRSQPRVEEEAEAIRLLLDEIRQGRVQWTSSEVLIAEVARTPDPQRRGRVELLLVLATDTIPMAAGIRERAESFVRRGLHLMDALHLACGEAAGVDVVLTTDDRFLGRANRLGSQVRVAVANPASWRWSGFH